MDGLADDRCGIDGSVQYNRHLATDLAGILGALRGIIPRDAGKPLGADGIKFKVHHRLAQRSVVHRGPLEGVTRQLGATFNIEGSIDFATAHLLALHEQLIQTGRFKLGDTPAVVAIDLHVGNGRLVADQIVAGGAAVAQGNDLVALGRLTLVKQLVDQLAVLLVNHPEFEKCGALDGTVRLIAFLLVHARQLDNDPVVFLREDDRLGNAQSVNAVADDFKGPHLGFLDGRGHLLLDAGLNLGIGELLEVLVTQLGLDFLADLVRHPDFVDLDREAGSALDIQAETDLLAHREDGRNRQPDQDHQQHPLENSLLIHSVPLLVPSLDSQQPDSPQPITCCPIPPEPHPCPAPGSRRRGRLPASRSRPPSPRKSGP